jgi:D-alanine-D-alanine ligase-like ATP-grasp enzyme
VLEVNTVPGMTPRSLAPLAACRAGISMASLCDALIRRCRLPAEVA